MRSQKVEILHVYWGLSQDDCTINKIKRLDWLLISVAKLG